jgi:hypothetical protein
MPGKQDSLHDVPISALTLHAEMTAESLKRLYRATAGEMRIERFGETIPCR